jgi:hypothetical protein
MNSLMLTHIVGENKGHLFDIQARNCGIFAPCTDGNPQPFKHARLGVRPSNIYKPNYTASVYDMGTDYRPLLRTVENGNSSVDYDEREGEVTLRGADDAAALQTPGPAGRMGHHLHGYADARFVGDSGAGMADGVFRVGAWADGDNHAMLTYDPRRDDPLGATVQSGGERLDDTGNGFPENVDLAGTAGAASWIAYVRADYQAFFYNYRLVYESWHDLTGWPRDPRLRVDARTLGGEATGRVRRLEYGDAAKAEGAEMYIAGRGDEQDDTIERPWRSDDIQVG